MIPCVKQLISIWYQSWSFILSSLTSLHLTISVKVLRRPSIAPFLLTTFLNFDLKILNPDGNWHTYFEYYRKNLIPSMKSVWPPVRLLIFLALCHFRKLFACKVLDDLCSFGAPSCNMYFPLFLKRFLDISS